MNTTGWAAEGLRPAVFEPAPQVSPIFPGGAVSPRRTHSASVPSVSHRLVATRPLIPALSLSSSVPVGQSLLVSRVLERST